MSVFVIAEAAVGWNGDLKQAEHSICMAKACGADAWKTQWTSDWVGMAGRRGIIYEEHAKRLQRLAWPAEYHKALASMCQQYGLEYMCTTFLQKDIAAVNPFVKRFKVSAFESRWAEFVNAHIQYSKQLIISIRREDFYKIEMPPQIESIRLHCVSEYPCPVEHLKIPPRVGGLSDHTTSVLTGALAVMRCAEVIEKHVKTADMKGDDPDQPHSLGMEGAQSDFGEYVRNIRFAEKAL